MGDLAKSISDGINKADKIKRAKDSKESKILLCGILVFFVAFGLGLAINSASDTSGSIGPGSYHSVATADGLKSCSEKLELYEFDRDGNLHPTKLIVCKAP